MKSNKRAGPLTNNQYRQLMSLFLFDIKNEMVMKISFSNLICMEHGLEWEAWSLHTTRYADAPINIIDILFNEEWRRQPCHTCFDRDEEESQS